MDITPRNILEGFALSYFAYKTWNEFSLKDLFRWLNRIPYVKKNVDAQLEKELEKVKPGLIKDRFKHVKLPMWKKEMQERLTLQEQPMNKEEILDRIDKICPYNKSDYKISGAIYADEERWSEMIGKIYGKTAWLNPTHSTVWPELTQMEAEVYAMCCDLFHTCSADENPAILTPGGTMSNIQAVYTYRNMALVEKGITKPNIVAPNTAHTSFKKACHILNIEYRMCRVDNLTGKADISDMRNMIDSNTICLVGSAPSFPYGIIDPVQEIAALALEFGIGFHLDCCLGGFQVPFVTLTEKCDFRVEGVTSISADPHKFGQTPKGISILMFRSNTVKKYLTFVDLNWTGGLYVMPDFFGSRAGSNVAILWAIMKAIGRDGYIKSANDLIEMREEICQNITDTYSESDLRILGNPELSTFGLKSENLNIHFLNKKMSEYGWEFNSLPDGLHFCLTEKHLLHKEKFIEEFMTDLHHSVEYIYDHSDEDPGDTAKIYCSAQEIPDFAEDVLDEIGRAYVEIMTMVQPPIRSQDRLESPKLI